MIVRLFPLWAIALSVVALFFPGPFIASKASIAPLLGVIMFGMGITLNASSFLNVLRRPVIVGLGMALQFIVMPFAAWLIGFSFQLEPELFVGMILVGACSGGTASNVICYLAKGDVALSITLTTCSTLLGIVLTPWLTLLYAGRVVDVSAVAMLYTITKIIVAPVILGLLVNRLFVKLTSSIKHIFPSISVAAIVIIIAIIAALNKSQLSQVGFILCLAVVLHNTIGLLSGYTVARLLGYNTIIARTLAIEVGMQNSGLAVALAIKHFAGLSALPGALFSIWHNISGSLLASWWQRRAEDSVN